MKSRTFIFTFILALCALNARMVNAQDQSGQTRDLDQQFERDMEGYRDAMRDAIERNRQIMEQILSSDFFEKMEADHQNFLKGLDHSNLFKDFGRPFFGQNNEKNERLKWSENEKERILIVDIGTGDRPLDIKIKNDMIHIKGEVSKREENKGSDGIHARVYSYQFNESQSLPRDVDGSKAQFEKKGEKLWIRFPKVDISEVKKEKKNKVKDPFGLSI